MDHVIGMLCPAYRQQTLIVEGYFEGNYRGGFLAVPKGGKYVGMADVRRAEIGGRLHGTLSARTLLEVQHPVATFLSWEAMVAAKRCRKVMTYFSL